MGTKIKGIYKGFKYISQIFGNGPIVVVKDHEMEIGYPTDVKHVAHIGWDGSAGTAPSWMNGFKTGPGFATTSVVNSGSALSPWSSQDYGETLGHKQVSDMFNDVPPTDIHNIPKKPRRKKQRSNSSPKLSSSIRSSRTEKSRAKFIEGNANAANIEVA